MDIKITTFLFLLLISSIDCASKVSSKPNVIFVVVDDLGWDDIGFHGSDQVSTPNIDNLATRSTILNSHYMSPLCSPSRASLLTGRYPMHMGLQHSVIIQSQRLGVPLNETMLPEYLRTAGYANHAVGKWHLGYFAPDYTPTNRGFDSFYGYLNENIDYWDHTSSLDFTLTADKNPAWGLDWHFAENGQQRFIPEEFGKYTTEILTNRAINIVDNYTDSDQPLFLYLAYQAVHSGNQDMPLQAPQEDINHFPNIYDTRRRTQVATVYNLDKHLGRFFTALEDDGYLDNTIILFTTDNGGPTEDCDFSWASNYPLRGSKHTLWEGGVRGASFVYLPPSMRAEGDSSSVSDSLTHISDWVPTVLEAAHIPIPPHLDGVSQLATLASGGEAARTEAVLNIDQRINYSAIIVGDYKLIQGEWINRYGGCIHNKYWYSPPGDSPMNTYKNRNSTVRCLPPPLPFHKAKHRCWSDTLNTTMCMFDIAKDPCEYRNLIDKDKHLDTRNQLIERLNYYIASAVPVVWPWPDPTGLPIFHHFKWGPWTNDTAIGGPWRSYSGSREEQYGKNQWKLNTITF